jgi:GT2 family glycosyltransferase
VLTVGVMICTYQRPESLGRCLDGLSAQTRAPDDVIAVHRQTDEATRRFIEVRGDDGLPLRAVIVLAPGLVAARNAGLQAGRTDVLAIIDDDVVPHPEWLERVARHFADPAVGGVGGRDHVHDGNAFDERLARRVGIVQWFGRVVANHHLGYGPPRAVALLKGANMSYRATAIAGLAFDRRLLGKSTQPHDDLAFSLAVGRRGWKMIYDPAALVYHYAGRPENRAYSSVGRVPAEEARSSAFNLVVAMWDNLSVPQRIAFALYSVLVGTSTDPGMVQALRYTPRFGLAAWKRFWLTQQGKATAWLALTRGRARAFTPVDAPGRAVSPSPRAE